MPQASLLLWSATAERPLRSDRAHHATEWNSCLDSSNHLATLPFVSPASPLQFKLVLDMNESLSSPLPARRTGFWQRFHRMDEVKFGLLLLSPTAIILLI